MGARNRALVAHQRARLDGDPVAGRRGEGFFDGPESYVLLQLRQLAGTPEPLTSSAPLV
jgi:hypothetical protein